MTSAFRFLGSHQTSNSSSLCCNYVYVPVPMLFQPDSLARLFDLIVSKVAALNRPMPVPFVGRYADKVPFTQLMYFIHLHCGTGVIIHSYARLKRNDAASFGCDEDLVRLVVV